MGMMLKSDLERLFPRGGWENHCLNIYNLVFLDILGLVIGFFNLFLTSFSANQRKPQLLCLRTFAY